MNSFQEAFNLLTSFDKELYQIIATTLKMSFFSTAVSCLIGIPLGALIESRAFKGKAFVKRIIHTLIGLPPVVAGLIVYMLFTHYGPFGKLGILFTVKVMVVAQVILITPLVIALTSSIVSGNTKQIKETAIGLNLSKANIMALYITENKNAIMSVILTAFGRAIAEVGAVSLVGGNIQFKTRVMTTAIMLETNKGNFSFALALGIILLIIAFVVNTIASFIERSSND
ncbi:MAG: ABC transporter permease [Eubacterium sp.]